MYTAIYYGILKYIYLSSRRLPKTRFSKTVKYNKKNYQWSSIIDLKAQELANYLLGKRNSIDFTTPNYKLDRIDNKELRDKILAISYSDWAKLGFSKGTLHQLKEKAKSDKPFYLQKRVKEKLGKLEWEKLI